MKQQIKKIREEDRKRSMQSYVKKVPLKALNCGFWLLVMGYILLFLPCSLELQIFNIWQDLILGTQCSPLKTYIHFLKEQDQKVNIPAAGENLSGLMGHPCTLNIDRNLFCNFIKKGWLTWSMNT